jgi:hypothetical protein
MKGKPMKASNGVDAPTQGISSSRTRGMRAGGATAALVMCALIGHICASTANSLSPDCASRLKILYDTLHTESKKIDGTGYPNYNKTDPLPENICSMLREFVEVERKILETDQACNVNQREIDWREGRIQKFEGNLSTCK